MGVPCFSDDDDEPEDIDEMRSPFDVLDSAVDQAVDVELFRLHSARVHQSPLNGVPQNQEPNPFGANPPHDEF